MMFNEALKSNQKKPAGVDQLIMFPLLFSKTADLFLLIFLYIFFLILSTTSFPSI